MIQGLQGYNYRMVNIGDMTNEIPLNMETPRKGEIISFCGRVGKVTQIKHRIISNVSWETIIETKQLPCI